ncbi:MAG TPA: carbon-nitrogen hydrolase family protein [Mucilaginibacter sp.]|jgi:predicted amidohydrolase|nr:carbon-nitrogen hydrolase family protein [Mucilaginibacter sp.]
MKIAVASPPYPKSLEDALDHVAKLSEDAAKGGAEIVCFPESYLPGYPGLEFEAEKCTPEKLKEALNEVCRIAAENKIAIVIPMDWYEGGRFLNVAFVVSKAGEILGYQSKNQLDPSEDVTWSAGSERSIFEVNGLKFGVTICHEGFRYPESVRWTARNGAQVVFHPNCTGSNIEGSVPREWGHKSNPYYEKAQMMRAMENTIYVATSNYTFKFPDSASAIISPDGECLAYQPYGEVGVAIVDIDLSKATGLLAKRYRAELYK